MKCQVKFLSTLSLRRATTSSTVIVILRKNFYPRSPCGERHRTATSRRPIFFISIHALLAESDLGIVLLCAATLRFLSTLSLRRATESARGIRSRTAISIHALLAESDSVCPHTRQHDAISIHALLAESDQEQHDSASSHQQFLSTLSLRRATIIRPHSAADSGNFYPRSPCGERQICLSNHLVKPTFLSTLSLRRATAKVHKTVGYFCAYETNFLEIASSC